jgi:hypothetical protein
MAKSCEASPSLLNRLYLAILETVLHQTKESEMARTDIRRIRWVRRSGKSPVFNFDRDFPAVVTARIVKLRYQRRRHR